MSRRYPGVKKRGAGWAFWVELPRDPRTGERRQEWEHGCRTAAEAARKRAEKLTKLGRGEHVRRSRESTGGFLTDTWLPAIRTTVKPSTWASYERNIRCYVVPRLGTVPLQSIDGPALNRLYAELLDAGRADGRGGLSARSVRYVHSILHRAFRDGVRWQMLARNPAVFADPPSLTSARAPVPTTWTANELEHFLAATGDERDWTAWLVLATTGMRRGEALGLRWSDVDLDAATISVTQTIGLIAGEITVTSTPKSGRARVVQLPAETTSALRAWRARRAEERLALGERGRDRGLVFCEPTGEPRHPERFSQLFARRARRVDVPTIRLHDLRHTFATLALEAGVHPKLVSEQLGHGSVGFTLDRYSHVTPAMASDAVERVAQLIRDAGAQTARK